MRSKLVLKRFLSNLLSFSGIHGLLEHLRLSEKAFILMYHRVLPATGQLPEYVQPGMFVTTATFEKQISYLRDRFEILFLDEMSAKVKKGEPLGGQCVLTFDDGWLDNYSEAFPLLKKYGVPATIFLATGFVGTNKTFWPEEITSCLAGVDVASLGRDETPSSMLRFAGELDALKQANRETFYEQAIEMMKKKTPDEREEILAFLRTAFSSKVHERQMMNWEEAREMSESGLVRFGAHTVNHELLDQLPLPSVRNEVSISRCEIEQRLRQKVCAFAYPNGNHSRNVRQILEEEGFHTAVTTRKGFLEHGCSGLDFPRIALHEDVSATVPLLRSRILLKQF